MLKLSTQDPDPMPKILKPVAARLMEVVTSGWPPPVLESLDDLKEQSPGRKMGAYQDTGSKRS